MSTPCGHDWVQTTEASADCPDCGPWWAAIGLLLALLTFLGILLIFLRRKIQSLAPARLVADFDDQDVVSDHFVIVGDDVTEATLPTCVELSNLLEYVGEKLRQDYPFQDEFKDLPLGLLHPHTEAHKPQNQHLSRYRGIVPYDHSRVILRNLESDDDTDFINASYIDGEYIAAQGPTRDTITDFWRMIWQEKCSRIVMLTNLHEFGVKKVEQYWPDSGEVNYGRLTIRMTNIQHYSDTILRTMTVCKGGESRVVLHFLFPGWPDHDVPRDTAGILHFRFQMHLVSRQATGPAVVHCSAGIGRTGTFIALDRLLTLSQRARYVNVFSCVKDLRSRRVQMIQTLEQYTFLYKALLDGVQCQGSIMEDSDFEAVYDRISRSSHDYENLNRVNQQYERLEAMKMLIDEQVCQDATAPENVEKNRDVDCLPDWRFQVYLSPFNGSANYINAVFFPGYKAPRRFISTQIPLRNTVQDFWRMVEEYECSTIIVLEPTDEFDVFWPTLDETLDVGYFEVKQTGYTDLNTMVQRTFSLVYKKWQDECKQLKQFCFKKWPRDNPVPLSFIDLLLLMEGVWGWTGRPPLSTIALLCRNGAERCGLFCVCWAVLERLRQEKIVSLMLTVKELRRMRRRVISSLDQYRFCEMFTLKYIKGFHEYTNLEFPFLSSKDNKPIKKQRKLHNQV